MSNDGEKRRVLVVDDEPSILDSVATSLRYEGYEVEEAATGRAALASARKDPPDLIVLDIMLPDVNGLEVTRQLRASGIRAPILFLTARDSRRGQGGRPHHRRRRLRDKAVRPGRDHRTRAGDHAPEPGRRRGRTSSFRGRGDGRAGARGSPSRPPHRADRHGVQSPAFLPFESPGECCPKPRSWITYGTTISAETPTWSKPTSAI